MLRLDPWTNIQCLFANSELETEIERLRERAKKRARESERELKRELKREIKRELKWDFKKHQKNIHLEWRSHDLYGLEKLKSV